MKRSPNCCYCEKPHGKSFPLIFQSCDACQDARDKRETDASNGLMTVSCPRCDLQFSAYATHSLTDAEREAVEWASKKMRLLGDAYDPERAAVLRGLLGRLGGGEVNDENLLMCCCCRAAIQHIIEEKDAEIARLRLAIRRLAEQDATLSVQNGNVIVEIDATETVLTNKSPNRC